MGMLLLLNYFLKSVRMKRPFLLLMLSLPLAVSACNCGTPLKIKPIQKNDKNLTCKDVILEINEAEFFRKEGENAKKITPDKYLLPMCWLSGYTSGNEAVDAANQRINYLSQLYDILDCGGKNKDTTQTGNIPPQPGGYGYPGQNDLPSEANAPYMVPVDPAPQGNYLPPPEPSNSAPQGNYSPYPPQGGYAPPQGYAPVPPQGYAPPPQGYVPPQNPGQ